jgi:hypothetical protein
MNFSKFSSPSPRLWCGLVLTLIALRVVGNAQVNGALQTTDSNGAIVNYNTGLACDQVYITGGPQNSHDAGLSPNGAYYFRVTDPSGKTILSTDDQINDRQLTVSTASGSCTESGKGVISSALPGTHLQGTPNQNSCEVPVQLWPFTVTPNNGGVYKAWISTTSDFSGGTTKTDNFKCTPPEDFCTSHPDDPACQNPPPSATIVGTKWYDFDADQSQDNGEVGIQDWLIKITSAPSGYTGATCQYTDSNGGYLFSVDPNIGGFTIAEADPLQTNWIHTTATSGIATAGTGAIQGPNFGNLCTGAGGGLTLGYWSNKNGQARINSADLCFLTSLNLVKADGSAFDPVPATGISSCANNNLTTQQVNAGKSALASWLLNASATNMAYMLSAQLATMELNIRENGVSSGATLYVGNQPNGCSIPVTNGEITIGDLMTDANLELLPPGNLLVGGSQLRTCQDFKKTALDNGNNNKNFVQAGACTHTFDETGCTF